jgi:REP element-mobilizing transposase RayT
MGHTFTNHLYHICFSTKQRRELITAPMKDRLHKYICGIARNTSGLVLRINGTKNHVHLLARVKPTMAVAEFIKTLKANSSKCINDSSPGPRLFQWQEGYASFTVSESVWKKVAAYIDRQEAHHGRRSYEEELAVLLEKHRIPFDRKAYLD